MSIVISKLTKRFGKTLVVNNVSLEVSDGKLFVLLGGSGSGKSTILRIVAGLTLQNAGTIVLNGRDVSALPPQARGTGFVFQNYSIFRHMTVTENIQFGLRIRGISGAQRRQRSDELLDLVGLAGLGERFTDQLSGGQQQRVALARALAYEPAVLLLDEPFGALDVKIRVQLRRTLKQIQRQLKVTTILVTHDQEEAFELADQIGVIDRGSLIEVGSPEDLYHRPRTEFVANFIGGSNFLTAQAQEGRARVGSADLVLPQGSGPGGGQIRVMFRPEAVLLQPEPFSIDSGVIVLGQGRVTERVFAGSQQRIRLELEKSESDWTLAGQNHYGRRAVQVEAVRPTEIRPNLHFAKDQKLWVGLNHYHILEASGFKILICSKEVRGEAAEEFGLRLTETSRGRATILTVVDSAASESSARERLEQLRRLWSERLRAVEFRIRQGVPIEEILLEVQESHYDLVILGKHARLHETNLTGWGKTVRHLLEQLRMPVLIVQRPRSTLARILICSAVGEPGKADVLIGGRLASLTGAVATVLHVDRPKETAERRRRAEQHLRQALSTLESMGVTSQSKIREEPALEHILREVEEGEYDLVVIGAPAPRMPRRLRWHDLAEQIVKGVQRPVLVVPMVE